MKHSCLVKLALSAALLGFLALGLAPVASAATTTTPITVTANVVNSCLFSADNMSFGDYSAINPTALTTSSKIYVTCTIGDAGVSIALSAGGSSSATTTTRKMSVTGTGPGVLAYSLTSDSGGTHNWGNATGTDTVAVPTTTGVQQQITVYGQVAAGQYAVPAALYTDTITATLTY